LHFINSLSAHLGQMLVHYGGSGLFAVNFLDSSFLTFPLINDVLLIHLASHNHRAALLYALEAAAGSVLGAFLVYGVARGGRRVLGRKRSDYEVAGARHWLERNDFVTMVVASLLPPPAPFKVFPVAAGALRMDPTRFVMALAVGRSLRFALEALIGVKYGAAAEAYLASHLAPVSILTIAMIVAFTVGYRWVVGRA
jgi:membrane protein YqaA with SNARE-associated domain